MALVLSAELINQARPSDGMLATVSLFRDVTESLVRLFANLDRPFLVLRRHR